MRVLLPASQAAQAARLLATAAGPPPAGDPLRLALSYCIQAVRTHDYENYVWAVQLPKELRAPILALRAFNAETALIGEHAKSEPLVMMRCQWWRDAVNAAYKGNPPEQPVATALAAALAGGAGLARYRLQRMISTREEELLRAGPPPSLPALEAYGEGTASQLLYLQLEAAGVASADADHAASHLGKALGIANVLRGTLHHAQRRRSYLPQDLCEKHGVSEEDILAGRASSALQDMTLEVATAAKAHLDEARQLRGELPGTAKQLLLPAVGCGLYLSALEAANFNLFDQRMLRGAYSPLRYQIQLKLAMFTGRY